MNAAEIHRDVGKGFLLSTPASHCIESKQDFINIKHNKVVVTVVRARPCLHNMTILYVVLIIITFMVNISQLFMKHDQSFK